ncbi:MAG: hypothetical protein GY771_13115 [bacterium]|nr:hypothetical protein [bacterium]
MARFFESYTEFDDRNTLSDERRDELIGKIARGTVERNLTAPAIFLLESVKPLTFIGSQVMVFFDPVVRAIFTFKEYNEIRLALEDRQNLERLLIKIEEYDAEFQVKLREKKKDARERKRARRGK